MAGAGPGRPAPLGQTPSQTLGPFFGMLLGRPGDANMADESVAGERIRVTGVVFDGHGAPIEDGLVEVWQANSAGRYRHPVDDRDDLPLLDGFTGFGRCPTDHPTGSWSVVTLRPGQVPDGRGGLQAPHLNLVLQARGMLDPVFTRVYFDDELSNDDDLVLAGVPEQRRHTLVASRGDDVDGLATFHLDLHVQGEHETVFFDV